MIATGLIVLYYSLLLHIMVFIRVCQHHIGNNQKLSAQYFSTKKDRALCIASGPYLHPKLPERYLVHSILGRKYFSPHTRRDADARGIPILSIAIHPSGKTRQPLLQRLQHP